MAEANVLDQLQGVAASVVSSFIAAYPDPTGRLINVLNDIQQKYRYLPAPLLDEVSCQMDVDRDQLDRMARFFDYLSLDQVGRCVIDVCDGTACHTQGAARLIREFEKLLGISVGQTTPDGSITLRKVACVGACSMAPVIVIDEGAYGRVRIQQIPSLVTVAQGIATEAAQAEHEDDQEKLLDGPAGPKEGGHPLADDHE